MTQTEHVTKGENSTHDQLVVADEDEVADLLEAVDRRGRDAVESYLDKHVDADTVMVQHFSTDTDFETGRVVTIDYWALNDVPSIAV